MRLVKATFVNNEIEPGWTILRDATPLGKHYLVDLDRIEHGTLRDLGTGKEVQVDAIWAVDNDGRDGFLPLIAFKLDADA